MNRACILGSGSWGTALAALLAHRGLATTLWGRDPAVADSINSSHINPRYLSSSPLPPSLRASTDLASSLEGADLVLFVLPSSATAQVAGDVASTPTLPPHATLLSCSKGIELTTGRRMSQLLSSHFPDHPVAVLSGPDHAEEVVRLKPTAVSLAAPSHQLALQLQSIFSLPWFRSYICDDPIGMEVGGATKNVYAIAAGAAQGLDLGDNATAALVSRGLAEMVRFGTAMGARTETFLGLSGVGDLVVTCYSEHSRNFRVGRGLGQGLPLDSITSQMGMVAEGVPNTRSIYQLARSLKVSTPLIDAVYAVLYEGKECRAVLRELFARDPKHELA
jgi:glycerol-3-phosphate dehydrogenase (NAD(P)+)